MPEPEPNSLAQTIHEMPWWVKAVVVVGNTFGFPAIMLGYYLAQDAGAIRNPVNEQLSLMQGELQEMKGLLVQGQTLNKEIVEALEDQNRQRQMRCVLKAQTEAEKKSCFPKSKLDE